MCVRRKNTMLFMKFSIAVESVSGALAASSILNRVDPVLNPTQNADLPGSSTEDDQSSRMSIEPELDELQRRLI